MSELRTRVSRELADDLAALASRIELARGS